MANYKAGRWAVVEVIRKFKEMGKSVRQYVPEGSVWGECNYDGSWDIPDYVWIDNKKYLCPDVEIYKDKNFNEIVVRVEVKSFRDFPRDIKIGKDEDLFHIKEWQIKEYLKLQIQEEIPCRIIFVLGNESNFKFYWATLDNLLHKIPYKSVKYMGTNDEYYQNYYFWRAKDLRTNF